MPLEPRKTTPGIPLHSEFRGGESDTIREIPPEWRAALDLTVEEIPMPWDRPVLELTDTILASKAEQQYTSERKMRTTVKPPGVFYLYESYTDRHKQLGVRQKSFHFIDDWPSVVPSPSGLMDVETRNFGNKHFELRQDILPGLFTAESFCEERPVVTPPDFRALLGESEHCYIDFGTATAPPDPMPSGIIKWCDNQEDVYTHKVCITEIDLLTLPRTISNKETNSRKQFVAVDRILELDTTIPLVPTALMDVEFTKLGDGTALEIHKTVPEVFDEHRQLRERAIVTPQDFRALLTEHEEDQVLTGTVVTDPFPLPTGVIRHSQERLTEFTYKDSVRKIDILSLPATIINVETNRFKQVETVTRILEDDSTVPGTPTSVRDVEFTKLGDGTALEVRKVVPIRFGEHKWTRERGIVTPQDFRALLTEKEESQVFAGFAADPGVPPAGVLRHEEEQIDVFNMRDVIRTIDTLSLPKTITNYQTNRFKQIETVDRILEVDTATPLVPTALMDVDFTKLGDGTALEVHKSVSIVFPQTKYIRDRSIVTPQDFRALLTEREVSSIFTGIAVDPGIPPVGVLRHEEEQIDVFNMRDTLRSIDTLSLPKDIDNKKTNRFKQVVAHKRRLELDTAIPLLPSDVRDVTFTVLGDGTALEEWEVVSEVFDEKAASTEIPDLVPELFRAVLPTTTDDYVESGATITDPPVLAIGDFFREEKRETEFTRRIRRRGRAGLTYPQSKIASREIGGEQFGAEVMQTSAFLDTTEPPVETGLGVVSSQVKNLGNSTWFRQTQKWDIATQWPILIGTETDPRTGIAVGITKQVVTAGTTGGVGVDGYVDVKPIDKWRSVRIASKLNPDSLPPVATWETSVEHRFPHTLLGLTWVWAAASAPFAYDFDSALVLDMHEGYAGPCRAKITESYTIGPPTDVITPTIFCPQGHEIGFAWAYAADPSSECGTCIGIAKSHARTWSIPPALHDALTIGGGVTLSGGAITGTLPATTPIGLPAAGTLITKACEVERWRFGVFYRRLTEIYVPAC